MTDDDEDITQALHRAADLLPGTNDRLTGVRRKRTAHVRRRVTAAAAVLIVAGAGSAFALTRGGSGSVVLPVTTTATASGEVTASGRVVEVPGKAPRFCAPSGVQLGLTVPPPPPQWCAFGVDVRGVDLTALENRREQAGAVEGYATLTGQVEGDLLVVTHQGATTSQPSTSRSAYHPYPGCTAPAGGWSQHPVTYDPPVEAMDHYRAQHVDEVAMISVARPDQHTAFPYVLTWGDPSGAQAAMRGSYGEEQCVLRSRWTQAEVVGAAHDLAALSSANQVYEYGSGHGLGDDGQIEVNGVAVRQTDALDALVARSPAGLVRIDYWLHPVTS
jgi:hypothetical protein